MENKYATIIANQRAYDLAKKEKRRERIKNFYTNWVETPLGGRKAVLGGLAGLAIAGPAGLICGTYLGKKERRQDLWKATKKGHEKVRQIGENVSDAIYAAKQYELLDPTAKTGFESTLTKPKRNYSQGAESPENRTRVTLKEYISGNVSSPTGESQTNPTKETIIPALRYLEHKANVASYRLGQGLERVNHSVLRIAEIKRNAQKYGTLEELTEKFNAERAKVKQGPVTVRQFYTLATQAAA